MNKALPFPSEEFSPSCPANKRKLQSIFAAVFHEKFHYAHLVGQCPFFYTGTMTDRQYTMWMEEREKAQNTMFYICLLDHLGACT